MKRNIFLLFAVIAVAILLIVKYSSTGKNSNYINLASPTPTLPIINGQFMTETNLGYSIVIPNEFKSEKNGEFSRIYYSKSLSDASATQGAALRSNFIYISFIPKSQDNSKTQTPNSSAQIEKLLTTQIGAKVNLQPSSPEVGSQYYTYTRGTDTEVSSYKAKGFVNLSPWHFSKDTTEYLYVLEFDKGMYVIGGYVGGALPKGIFDQILSTFKLLDSRSSS